eukprot:3808125-Karenia_brevis.AAC.1
MTFKGLLGFRTMTSAGGSLVSQRGERLLLCSRCAFAEGGDMEQWADGEGWVGMRLPSEGGR